MFFVLLVFASAIFLRLVTSLRFYTVSVFIATTDSYHDHDGDCYQHDNQHYWSHYFFLSCCVPRFLRFFSLLLCLFLSLVQCLAVLSCFLLSFFPLHNTNPCVLPSWPSSTERWHLAPAKKKMPPPKRLRNMFPSFLVFRLYNL